MICKALEVRDRGTFIPVLAVDMNPGNVHPYDVGVKVQRYSDSLSEYEARQYLLRRCGYPCDGRPNVIVTRLDGNGQATNDPYGWKDRGRTFPIAHQWIIDNWSTIQDGDVVDVQFILGETKEPKKSERETVR